MQLILPLVVAAVVGMIAGLLALKAMGQRTPFD